MPQRLIALQKETVDNGLEMIKHHWDGEEIEQVRDDRVSARRDHEGVDCYWNDAEGTIDGHLDSKTFFGKMWVKAYPFRPRAMKIVGCYAAFEAFLQLYVPGKKFKATPTATGHIPVYKANGVACYLISIVALFALKYFRIFNPIRQAERFDPDGAFVRSMIPELAGASAKQTLEPWKFGGVGSYPKPMIDLSAARDKTLQVWKITKKNT